ncbi:Kef-type potassium/proton antiporter accessory protein, CPA2 family [Alteromonadaceae bacterium Bs31]|nr:Kef-type potassium/proton antiporter accessory protein, CPA2 family [Alteromonadaceae bacterium Bs31]
MSPTKKVLILFAHPSSHRSEVNAPLFQASQQVEGVTCVDLYARYPKQRINIDKEQQQLNEHDIIIFMFPLYWYSTPAILKEWQDLVLEHGYAYGSGGNALHGKTFLCAISAGGAKSAYQSEGYNHFTVRELLRPLEQTAYLTGMYYLPPFTLFSARNAVEEHRLQSHIDSWLNVLKALRDDKIDVAAYSNATSLNENLRTFVAND